jgi:predicted nucleic acid-binding protein
MGSDVRVLFDTSVLVAGIVEAHPVHSRSLPWLQRVKERDFEFLVVSHSLAETYAVLTTLPVKPRISPSVARSLVRANIESSARIIPLSTSDYRTTIMKMAELGLSGGSSYDALIATVAQKVSADRLLTLNADDFYRVWPEGKDIISVP